MYIYGKTYMLSIKTIWGDSIPALLRYSGSFWHRADFCSGCQGNKYTKCDKIIKFYSFDDPYGGRSSYCTKCVKELTTK